MSSRTTAQKVKELKNKKNHPKQPKKIKHCARNKNANKKLMRKKTFVCMF